MYGAVGVKKGPILIGSLRPTTGTTLVIPERAGARTGPHCQNAPIGRGGWPKRKRRKGKRRRKKAATGTWVGETHTVVFGTRLAMRATRGAFLENPHKKVRKSPKRSEFWAVDRFNGGTAIETRLDHTFHQSAHPRAAPP